MPTINDPAGQNLNRDYRPNGIEGAGSWTINLNDGDDTIYAVVDWQRQSGHP